jgi:hypothetical protein
LKKKRRIEITAFRRTVTIAGREPAVSQEKEAPQTLDCGPRPADDSQAQRQQADLVEAVLSHLGDEPSPDLEHLIDAVASRRKQ